MQGTSQGKITQLLKQFIAENPQRLVKYVNRDGAHSFLDQTIKLQEGNGVIPNSSQQNSAVENIYRFHFQNQYGWRFMYSSQQNKEQGWILDGICFKTPKYGVNGAVPIFQYQNGQSNTFNPTRFMYSASPYQQNEDWILKGIKFFAFNQILPNTVPIYEYRIMQSDGAIFLSQSDYCHGWYKIGIAFMAYPGDVK